jgi:hypothetical protein
VGSSRDLARRMRTLPRRMCTYKARVCASARLRTSCVYAAQQSKAHVRKH